jgi:hypothetical protein
MSIKRSEAAARSVWPAEECWPARCKARRPRIQNLIVFRPTLRSSEGWVEKLLEDTAPNQDRPAPTREPHTKVLGATKTRGVGQM